jgi:protein-disulfide isomerase
MSQVRIRFILFIFASVFLIALAACGGTGGTPVEDSEVPIPFIGDTVSESAAQSSPTMAAESPGENPTEADENGIPVGFTAEGRPYRGRLDAPVVMEEFSDYQCPFCGRFSEQTLPGLLANQIAQGEVVLIFYDFPLEAIHPQATAAANAARCAGEHGATAYWAMHDRLFAAIDEWSNDSANDLFRGYGAELGLDAAVFGECLDELRYEAEIAADLELGQRRGVNSTPSFFMNDQPVIGAYPLDFFNDAIAQVRAGESIVAEVDEPSQPSQPTIKPTPAVILMDDAAGVKGDPAAPVTIVEYTDYQCPYCARHATSTLPLVLVEMIDTGRAHYIIKDFPLDNIHPEARAAAVAARCAGEVDAYWPMHDALFLRQQEWSGLGNGINGYLATLAGDLGLDVTDFETCQASGRYDGVVQANLEEGLALGVRGTPAFFINGFPISGAQPYELFDYAVGLAEEGTLADAYVSEEQEAPPEPSGPVEVEIGDAFSIGAADAPVVIVEFTDFQCPFCARHFAQTFSQIKADYIDTGKVRYYFKDFPLTIHPQAPKAAEAARCAGDQGEFLAMHGLLFAHQTTWSGRSDAESVFSSLAESAGLDMALFNECLSDGRYEAAVAADLEQGIRLGINGTPAFFLNGNYISGAQPYSVFQQAIDSLLADPES